MPPPSRPPSNAPATRHLAALLGGLLLGAAPAAAQAPAGDVDRLIGGLGAPAYADRAAATAAVERLGQAAVPALRARLQDPNPEVRLRCRLLLDDLTRGELDRRLERFIARGEEGGAPAPAGWKKFREVVGGTRDDRGLFAEIYRHDRDVLAGIEADPAAAARLYQERCLRIVQRPYNFNDPARVSLGEVGAVVYAAACLGKLDNNRFSQLYSVCSRPEVTQRFHFSDPALRRLITKLIEDQGDSPQLFYQRLYMARNLHLHELIDNSIKPQIRAQAAKARKDPANLGELQNAISWATQLSLTDVIEADLKPLVRELALRQDREYDANTFQQVVYMAQNLQMQHLLAETLAPVFVERLEANPAGMQISQSISLARLLGAEEQVQNLIRPLYARRCCDFADSPTMQEFYQVLNDGRSLGNPDVFEGVFKPAAEEWICRQLESSPDVNQLQQLAGATQNLALAELTENVWAPYLTARAEGLGKGPVDLNEIRTLCYTAQNLQMQGKMFELLRPAFARYVRDLDNQSPDANTLSQAMNLAQTLEAREALPLAVRLVGLKGAQAYHRGPALQYIGRFGGKEHIEALEPLLADNSAIGNAFLNNTRIQTQIRDVALATMVHLSGQDLQKYGFPYAIQTRLTYTQISYNCFGFADDRERDQAVARWQAWLKEEGEARQK